MIKTASIAADVAKGSCLCGACKYQLSGHINIFQYCHCSRCRKFTGSAFAANLFVKPEQFEWLGNTEKVATFEPQDTPYFATCFCKQCGSSLPWTPKGGHVMIIPAGTLDEEVDIKPDKNIYCSSDAGWYVEPTDLPKHDAMPLHVKSE